MSSSLNDYVWFFWPRFTNTENLLGPSFIGRPHCQTVHKVIGRRKSVEPGVNLKRRIDRSNIYVSNASRNDLICVRTFSRFHLSQDIFIEHNCFWFFNLTFIILLQERSPKALVGSAEVQKSEGSIMEIVSPKVVSKKRNKLLPVHRAAASPIYSLSGETQYHLSVSRVR